MNLEEALEWLRGERSMSGIIPVYPFATRQTRIAEADAAKKQQAYWIVRAHEEKLLQEENHL